MKQDQKQDLIIEAAIKRFAHFGVAKTTMSEIAADLSMSKASLYYYFPDKLSLYAEVFRTVTEKGSAQDFERLAAEPDPFRAIQFFLEKRTEFIISNYKILEFIKTGFSAFPPEIQALFTRLKKQELQRLTGIIQKGVDQGLFHLRDVRRTAELFHDFLEGFRHSSLTQNGNFFPEKKEFLALLKKEAEFSLIFFNGLTIKRD